MKFESLDIPDVVHIIPDLLSDNRGFFSRTFCQSELQSVGASFVPVQTNLSFNNVKGTLRGLHFQIGDSAEDKIVQCLQGEIFDVAVDLRSHSKTYGHWVSQRLCQEKLDMLYIPKGFAHGFITLADDTLIQYFMSSYYVPEKSSGVRWDDPLLAIAWPNRPVVLSEKDRSWPLLQPIL